MKKIANIPLITEPHPEGYTGSPFITLIRYNNESILTIIDNVTDKQIVGIVLDLCRPNNIDEMNIIRVAEDWFESNRHKKYPVSIEFSRLGLADLISPIIRSYPIEYVTRVIGPLPRYKMTGPHRTKKKRRKSMPVISEPTNKNIIITTKTLI